MRSSSVVAVTALVWSAAIAPRTGLGQNNSGAAEASRRSLIEDAQRAATAGDHVQAVDLAVRAGQIRMSPPLRRLIAEQQAANGQLAEAFGSADQCVREATAAEASLPGREQHITVCRGLVEALRRRVGRVRIVVHEPPDSLHVRVANVDVPSALLGVPYVVTPGTVVVDAQAQGFATLHREIPVTAGATVDVNVTLTPQAVVVVPPSASPAPTHAVVAAVAPAPRVVSPPSQSGFGAQRIASVALGVGALAAVGVGIGLNVAQRDAVSSFNNGGCWMTGGMVNGPAGCAGWSSGAGTDQIVSIIGYAGAGLFAAGAVVLFVTAPSSHTETAHPASAAAHWTCAPTVGTAGLSCAGTF